MRRFRPTPILLSGLLAACVGIALYATSLLGGLERDSVALRFSLRHTEPPKGIVVVAIDARTFSDLEQQWPFPRSLHGKAVDALHAAGVKEIVYDVQFTEPTTEREDLALYDAIGRAGGAVLATSEVDDQGGTRVLGGEEMLQDIHARAGAANLADEPGAVISSFPHSVSGLESLAVAAAERATGRQIDARRFEGDTALIDYRGGPGTFPRISFSDLVEGRVDPRLLRGQIAVVGAWAPTLQDVHATPTSGSDVMAGPEVQANAIWTALHDFPLRRSPVPLDVALVVLLALACALLRRQLRVLPAVAVTLGLGAAHALAAQLAFTQGLILPVVTPLAALLVGAAGMVVVSHLAETLERMRVAHYNEVLEGRVLERTEELRRTQLEIIQRLGQAAESRDHETGEHIERMSRLCQRLALATGMSPTEAEQLRHAAAMHDVGKIGIPDAVLHKPGRLNPEEWEVMETHTTMGAKILSGSSSELVQMAERIALTHHERWDGSGYPHGLRGEEIPLEGRICSICDVFDALTTERAYKYGWAVSDALSEIERQSGRQFDPRLVEVFRDLAPELEAAFAARELPAPGPASRAVFPVGRAAHIR